MTNKRNNGVLLSWQDALNRASDCSWWIYGAAALTSVLFSIIVIWQDEVVNPDSIYYLEAAASFLGGSGWQSFHTAFRWGLLPILMAMAQKVTGLPLIDAGLLVITLLNTGVVLAFIRLVAQFDSRPILLIVAAVVVLSNPHLNEYRAFIIRDPGYWCFYLLSISFFVKYLKEPAWRYAIGWSLAMIAATLFRVEGVIFFGALPLLILFMPGTAFLSRLMLFLRVNAVGLIMLGCGLAMFMILAEEDHFLPARIGELEIWLTFITQEMFMALGEKAEQLKAIMLPLNSAKYGLHAVLIVLAMIFILKLIGVLHPLFFGLAIYSFWCVDGVFSKKERMLLWWLALLNIVILSIYLFRHYFLQGRYLVPLVLVILLVVPFALVKLYDHWQVRKQQTGFMRWMPNLVVGLFAWVLLDGLTSFGPSKQYIIDSADWLKHEMPTETRLVSNVKVLAYYADKSDADWIQIFRDGRVNEALLQELDKKPACLALKVSRKHPEEQTQVETAIGLRPLKEFSNKRGDKLALYCMP